MQLIAELCEEHRLLEEQAGQLLRIVRADYPDPAAVAALRWGMTQALLQHCAREDESVYDRLIGCGDSVAAPIAWYYHRDHHLLSRDFASFTARWPVARIGREWLAFRAETEEMVERLALRILREETVLYPHAERVLARRAA